MTDAIRTPDELLEGLPGFPWAPRYREVGGLRLARVDEGAGAPVVMWHGEPTWSFLWRPFPNEASKAGAWAFPELILAGPAMAGAASGQRTLDALREDRRLLLMLWGREDPVLPPAVGEALASALGRPAPRVIDDAEHFLQEDRGEEVGAISPSG